MLAPRNTLHSTPLPCIQTALRMMEVAQPDVLYDIGCGDGRVVVEAATSVGCRCVGIDLNPTRVAEAKAAVEDAGVGALVTVHEGNALELDMKPASCMFLFLIKRGLRIMHKRLSAMMESRRRANAACPKLRVVSYLYRIPDVKPVAIKWVSLPDIGAKYPLYLYHYPCAPCDDGAAADPAQTAKTALHSAVTAAQCDDADSGTAAPAPAPARALATAARVGTAAAAAPGAGAGAGAGAGSDDGGAGAGVAAGNSCEPVTDDSAREAPTAGSGTAGTASA